jgi:hypothetical protein
MRRIVLAGLLGLAGCCDLVGPRQRLCQPGRVDDPRLPVREQEARGRDRLAIPDPSWDVAPRTFAEQPSFYGRY